ncbi:MAG TPA: hypothetical protein DD477_08830 [Spirochaetaceae bacterium]|nr:MAG: hypothetical protein A2Y32_09060 [Spirochaetes bacterium GWF1_60_12]HBO41306.1 hypothetical protein [Spirochaetaceae bacterium]
MRWLDGRALLGHKFSEKHFDMEAGEGESIGLALLHYHMKKISALLIVALAALVLSGCFWPETSVESILHVSDVGTYATCDISLSHDDVTVIIAENVNLNYNTIYVYDDTSTIHGRTAQMLSSFQDTAADGNWIVTITNHETSTPYNLTLESIVIDYIVY